MTSLWKPSPPEVIARTLPPISLWIKNKMIINDNVYGTSISVTYSKNNDIINLMFYQLLLLNL